MGVDLISWRVRIGKFLHSNLGRCNIGVKGKILLFQFLLLKIFDLRLISDIWWLLLTIILCGDIELNPGPSGLKLLHWNLNSIVTDNFIRKTLLEAFNTSCRYDILAISETGLRDSHDNENLHIEGYDLYRRNLQETQRCGGVLIYVNENICSKERPDLETNIDQLIIELTINNKKIFVTNNYRKHHKNRQEVVDFMKKFNSCVENVIAENPFCSLFLGDFNCHNSSWLCTDTTDFQGEELYDILNDNALHQLVSEPTHIINNSKTCIDLVITNQRDIIRECSVKPSLDSRCHHLINHIELNTDNPEPPPFYRKVWHYGRANKEAIQAAVNSVNWINRLNELSYSPDKQLDFLDETLLNIFSNFIPSKTIRVKPQDPPWYNNNIRDAYKRYNRLFRRYKKRGYPAPMKTEVETRKKIYTDLVSLTKENYLKTQGLKLCDQDTSVKTYWSILKNFTNPRKFPKIPPLNHNNRQISDFQEKAEIFNAFFSSQCTVLETNSELPQFELKTNTSLENITFTIDDVISLLKNLKPDKSHGWDNISARMIKLCGDTIAEPLSIIFKNCIQKGIFPKKWKMANVTPIHKKESKNLVKNYRPISLLPLFSKLFEKIIFNDLYSYLISNNLISKKQAIS